MKKQLVSMLCVCAVMLSLASTCFSAVYQGVCGIQYNGVTTDRGIAVNKNSSSLYYGYFYGVASDSGAVRIYRPNSDGTAATGYTDTGKKLSYATSPASSLLMNAFVGPDDTVYVLDFSAKQVCTGPADGAESGGNLTSLFSTTNNPRGMCFYTDPDTGVQRILVAETGGAKCEVYKNDGSGWVLEKDLGTLGLAAPYFVTVDSAGNSYWGSKGTTAPFIKKVDASLNEDTTWTWTKPSWLKSTWTFEGLAYVNDAVNTSSPEYLYVAGYNATSVCRYDMSGNFIDGFGNSGGTSSPPATYDTTIALSGIGGNQDMWLIADDQRNVYILATYPGTTKQAYKFHMYLQTPPAKPTGISASNDVYGQIRLAWTAPSADANAPTAYKIYRGTTSGAETLYATADSYPKWKDSAQGTTSGGPFYYYVKSVNAAGDSLPSDEIGPISPSVSTAPAPRSLEVALSYSEINKADTANNPSYDRDWGFSETFLKDRAVNYTTVYDADSTRLNIENDDIAGYKLLVLALNRSMSSYTAQCIADYAKYSQGIVFTNYVDSIANIKGNRQSDFILKDVMRCSASTNGNYGSPWVSSSNYQFLKPVDSASEAAALFSGLTGSPGWDGARQWAFNDYLAVAYTDGTASEVGKWYNSIGSQSIADPDDAGLIVGYSDSSKTRVQSIYTGANWCYQASGSFSATKLVENILGFAGITFTEPIINTTIGDIKSRNDNAGIVLTGKVVTRVVPYNTYQPYLQDSRYDDACYIEENDRSSGIKLMLSGFTLQDGDIVNIAGAITTDSVMSTAGNNVGFERMISVLEITSASGGTISKPLFVDNKNVGGGTQVGTTGGVGLNTVGLLVTIVGSLTQADTIDMAGNNYFLIDDGSGFQGPAETVKGIKVLGVAPTSTLGTMVRLTGVIGAEYAGAFGDPAVDAIIPIVKMGLSDEATIVAP